MELPEGNDNARTQAALRHCRDVTRRCARNFYYGLKLSPEPQRSALYAIYAWMRRADDIVDHADHANTQAITSQLADFRAATVAALNGAPPDHDPLLCGLAAIARRFHLPPEQFHKMLDGQIEDLSGKRYRTFDELRGYCERVASTVGLICIDIWGYSSAEAPRLAVDRGIAFQLTNILRDYRQDHDSGRIYLPEEDFARHGIMPADLRAWSRPKACDAFLLEQIARTESFYQSSAPLEQMITATCRPTLWAMTRIYHGLLQKMSRNPADLVHGGRMRLSALQKGTIALRAKWISHFVRSRGPDAVAATPGRAD